MRDTEDVASYVRSSSDKQEEAHQIDDIDDDGEIITDE